MILESGMSLSFHSPVCSYVRPFPRNLAAVDKLSSKSNIKQDEPSLKALCDECPVLFDCVKRLENIPHQLKEVVRALSHGESAL